MSGSRNFRSKCIAAWDRFLFEGCDPRIASAFRIGFAILILIQVAVVWNDAAMWFSDEGVLSVGTAKLTTRPLGWSLFYWVPSAPPLIQGTLVALALHAVLMLLGVFSRVQAAAIFVWLVSLQNRNPLINDGEDTVFRIFAFMMIWLPLDAYWSILRRSNDSVTRSRSHSSAWGLRLIQIEMTAIYASAAISKLGGETWQDGTAMWYVSRMTDNFGRLIPSALFDHFWVSAGLTWGALFIEAVLPIALWNRRTRKIAILAGVALHLGIELSMNLFLFEWVMVLGLLTFVVPSEWAFVRPRENWTIAARHLRCYFGGGSN
ncbi:MAG: hypothetical protein FJ308_04030 [Planctomycetes bacterium]|nr:hypothetical protein [Planctomycetota bacterium]